MDIEFGWIVYNQMVMSNLEPHNSKNSLEEKTSLQLQFVTKINKKSLNFLVVA